MKNAANDLLKGHVNLAKHSMTSYSLVVVVTTRIRSSCLCEVQSPEGITHCGICNGQIEFMISKVP